MNNYIKRSLLAKLIRNLADRQIYALVGPRQAGKTTLFYILKNYLQEKKSVSPDNIFFFTFEDPEIRAQFNEDPKEFVARRIENLSGRIYFFFDEYHWAKEGGQKLKLLFDLFSPRVKFLITGSSSLEITFQTGKYLVGRVYFFHLYPLSFAEFLQTKEKEVLSAYKEINQQLRSFKLPKTKTIFERKLAKYFEEFCLFGGYPEVVKRKSKEDKQFLLSSIRKTYLEKDIRSLLLLEDVEGYRKLLQVLAGQIGALLSYNRLCSDTGLTYPTLKKYLALLEETFLVRRIRPFHKNIASELRKNPKIYFFDLGMRNSVWENFSPLNKRSDKGELVENFVFTQLAKEAKMPSFWRTKAKAEVDFVLKQAEKVYPLEVKYRKLKNPSLSRSFASFLSSYKPEKGIVLTGGFWGQKRVEKTQVIFLPVWYW
jgi:hypothetical protein